MITNIALGIVAVSILLIPAMAIKVAIDDMKSSENE